VGHSPVGGSRQFSPARIFPNVSTFCVKGIMQNVRFPLFAFFLTGMPVKLR
jgi:hypothetical protein